MPLMIFNYKSICVLLISTFICQNLIANQDEERLAVENKLREYLESIDQKNASRISEHFYFDRKGWDRGPVFCLVRVRLANSVM